MSNPRQSMIGRSLPSVPGQGSFGGNHDTYDTAWDVNKAPLQRKGTEFKLAGATVDDTYEVPQIKGGTGNSNEDPYALPQAQQNNSEDVYDNPQNGNQANDFMNEDTYALPQAQAQTKKAPPPIRPTSMAVRSQNSSTSSLSSSSSTSTNAAYTTRGQEMSTATSRASVSVDYADNSQVRGRFGSFGMSPRNSRTDDLYDDTQPEEAWKSAVWYDGNIKRDEATKRCVRTHSYVLRNSSQPGTYSLTVMGYSKLFNVQVNRVGNQVKLGSHGKLFDTIKGMIEHYQESALPIVSDHPVYLKDPKGAPYSG